MTQAFHPHASVSGEPLAYLLAFACFGGAVMLLILGTRGLLRVMRGEWGVELRS
jgi:hypothetical protein